MNPIPLDPGKPIDYAGLMSLIAQLDEFSLAHPPIRSYLHDVAEQFDDAYNTCEKDPDIKMVHTHEDP